MPKSSNSLERVKDSLSFAMLREAMKDRLEDSDAPILLQLIIRDPDRAAVIIKRLKNGKEKSDNLEKYPKN